MPSRSPSAAIGFYNDATFGVGDVHSALPVALVDYADDASGEIDILIAKS